MLYYIQIGNKFYLKPISEKGLERYKKKYGKPFLGLNNGVADRFEYASMIPDKDEAEELAVELNGIVKSIADDQWFQAIDKLRERKGLK